MITINNASKSFRHKQLFDDLNFELQQNSVTVLLGENGAGKSTLMNCIAGLESFSNGSCLIDGQTMTMKQLQQIIGYVPQEIALWEHLTVEQNIQFFKKLKKGSISQKQIENYCEVLNLVDLKQPVEQLSGGTKRKANLLIGILHEPKLLILDEPTVGIDLKSRYDIHKLIRHLREQCTIFMTTHHLDEVEAVSDAIYIMGKDPFYEEVLKEKNQPFAKIG